MSTKNNSSGSQFNPKGITQGITLVGHEDGLPINRIVDGSGKHRLCVDANVTIGSAVVNVDIDSDTDNIAIRNTANDDELLIYPDGTIKVRMTDDAGNPFSSSNPLFVNIAGGSLDVNLSATTPTADSVRIYGIDGGAIQRELLVDAAGKLQVITTQGTSPWIVSGTVDTNTLPGENAFSQFGEATSVPSASTASIISYTVPATKTLYLSRIEVSGSNIATYEILVNSVIAGRRRTWFGGPISESFEFPNSPFKLVTGDVLDIQVINFRPMLGDFEARLQGELV